jgi:hypothetical protein
VRTLGTALMLFGLFSALLGPPLLGLMEAHPTAQSVEYMDLMFFGGAGLTLLGAILFSLRVMLGRWRR